MNAKLLLVAGLLACLTIVEAQARDPFTFVPGWSNRGLAVYTEAATGSRDAGSFGRHGSEGLARALYAPVADWTLDAAVGVVDNHLTDEVESSVGVEGRYSGFGHGLALGAGYRNDYEEVSVPYARLTWVSSARFVTGVSAIAEFPQADYRDEADLILAVAQTFPCGGLVTCAVELAGEDLEGFYVEDEAEGGAKFILGPTVSFGWSGEHQLKIFAGWIHAATVNEPTRPDFPDYRGGRDGAMFRIALRFGT